MGGPSGFWSFGKANRTDSSCDIMTVQGLPQRKGFGVERWEAFERAFDRIKAGGGFLYDIALGGVWRAVAEDYDLDAEELNGILSEANSTEGAEGLAFFADGGHEVLTLEGLLELARK